MDLITAPAVHNLSWEKEQITLELNNKIILRSLCKYSWSTTQYHIYRSCQSDFAYTCVLRDGLNPSRRRRLHTKVKMTKCIFGDQARNKRFQLYTCVYYFGIFCEISFRRDLGTEYIVTTAFHSNSTRTSFVWESSC